MCGKVEIESMKHQLTALGVLRPKIAAIRREEVPALLPYDAADADAAPAATSALDVTEEVTNAEDWTGVTGNQGFEKHSWNYWAGNLSTFRIEQNVKQIRRFCDGWISWFKIEIL